MVRHRTSVRCGRYVRHGWRNFRRRPGGPLTRLGIGLRQWQARFRWRYARSCTGCFRSPCGRPRARLFMTPVRSDGRCGWRSVLDRSASARSCLGTGRSRRSTRQRIGNRCYSPSSIPAGRAHFDRLCRRPTDHRHDRDDHCQHGRSDEQIVWLEPRRRGGRPHRPHFTITITSAIASTIVSAARVGTSAACANLGRPLGRHSAVSPVDRSSAMWRFAYLACGCCRCRPIARASGLRPTVFGWRAGPLMRRPGDLRSVNSRQVWQAQQNGYTIGRGRRRSLGQSISLSDVGPSAMDRYDGHG